MFSIEIIFFFLLSKSDMVISTNTFVKENFKVKKRR